MANFEMAGICTLSYDDWLPIFYEGAANWRNGEYENFSSLGRFNLSISFTCSVCKRGPGESCTLKRCSGCFVNTYCSRECQKKDHPAHRKFWNTWVSWISLKFLKVCNSGKNFSWNTLLPALKITFIFCECPGGRLYIYI